MSATKNRETSPVTFPEVLEIESLHDRVRRELAASKASLSQFISRERGLARTLREARADTSSRTGTSFAVYAMSEAGLLRSHLVGIWPQLNGFMSGVLVDAIGPIPPRKGSAEAQVEQRSLNEYSVPIWLSGLIGAAQHDAALREKASASKAVLDAVKSLTVETSDGSLQRVGTEPGDRIPSAYLTYWAACALLRAPEVLGTGEELAAGASKALQSIARWAELELSRMIADHHASLQSRFDVVECIACACIVARLHSSQAPWLKDEARQLSVYGVSLVLDHYFSAGSFKLSRPVFADDKHNAILCPTAEVLFMILSSFSGESASRMLSRERLLMIFESFEWCLRNKRSGAFSPDFDVSLGGGAEANVFATSATLAFFELFARALDNYRDASARVLLGVPEQPAVELKLKRYPQPLADSVSRKVIEPIKNGQRSVAKYSMILHGPPGTAKTTIARKLAHDLGWPLLEISQSDFLRKGLGQIEAEAEHIFKLCSQLKDVVILFDEVEELILTREELPNKLGGGADREGRLSTTAMLPKIHDLRDRRRVVFVFATNRLVRIDGAATRLGRFDIISFVDYPAIEDLIDAASRFLTERAEDAMEVPGRASDVESIGQVKRVMLSIEKMNSFAVGDRLYLTYNDMLYCCETLMRRATDWADAGKKIEGNELEVEARRVVQKLTKKNGQDFQAYRSATPEDSDRL